MRINDFLDLVTSGFDVSFNHGDVFYTISLIKDDEQSGRVYGTGGDNDFMADFAATRKTVNGNIAIAIVRQPRSLENHGEVE